MKQLHVAAIQLAVLALATGLFGARAGAQETSRHFPWKPITLLMPYTAGSTSDVEARIYQDSFSAGFDQPLVIDYKPGGSGIIANTALIKAEPDGHTIGYQAATLGILPAVRHDMPYDWKTELTPVIQTTQRVFVMAVRKDFPASNFKEYIAYAKANPGKVTWSTVGAGGALHMSGEWLAAGTGIKLNFVHYKGAAMAEVDMLGGRIDSAPKGMVSALPLVKQGKIRVLAIITNKRTSLMPDVPTVEEMGVPGYNYPSWVGIATGAHVPRAAVDRLYEGFVKVIKAPKAMQAWEKVGTNVVALNPDDFRKRLLAETALWEKLVRENNIKFTR